jgi:hypothetical protein
VKRWLGVLVATLVVAGCGSNDKKADTAASASGLTRAGYVKSADAVCRAGSARMKAVLAKLPQQPSKQQIRTFTVQSAIPELLRELRELRALPRPAGDKAALDEVYNALGTAIGKLTANPDLVSASGAASPFTKPDQLAHKYGLKFCGTS